MTSRMMGDNPDHYPSPRTTWAHAAAVIAANFEDHFGAWEDVDHNSALFVCLICGMPAALQLIPQPDGSIKAECLSDAGCRKRALEKALREEWGLSLRRRRPRKGPGPPVPELEVPDFWDASVNGDAWRLIKSHGPKLLIGDDGHWGKVYALNVKNGVWQDTEGLVMEWHNETAKFRALEAARMMQEGDMERGRAVRFQNYALTVQKAAAMDNLLKGVMAAHREMEKREMEPAATIVPAMEIDADKRYLGVANGIVDLDTGRLLGPEEGRHKLITRSTGVKYEPGAKDPAIDALLAHLEDTEREYLLNAVGYALRGNPAGHWYLLAGPRRSGKTTFLRAVAAALGRASNGGYAFALSQGALLYDRYGVGNTHHEHLKYFPLARFAYEAEVPSAGRAGFNEGLLKRLTGGDNLMLREIHQKSEETGPATASIFYALNQSDLERLDLKDDALEIRSKILPWPPFPQETARDPDRVNAVTRPKAARAMLALLVERAVTNRRPPEDIPSVTDAVAERRAASLGRLGQWFQEWLRVTRQRNDYTLPGEIWEAAAADLGASEDGKIDGMDRPAGMALMRVAIPYMPRQTSIWIDGKKQRAYAGVKLLTAEEAETGLPSQGAMVCAGCGGPPTGEEYSPAGLCGFCEMDRSFGPNRAQPFSAGDVGALKHHLATAEPGTLDDVERAIDELREARQRQMKMPNPPDSN